MFNFKKFFAILAISIASLSFNAFAEDANNASGETYSYEDAKADLDAAIATGDAAIIAKAVGDAIAKNPSLAQSVATYTVSKAPAAAGQVVAAVKAKAPTQAADIITAVKTQLINNPTALAQVVQAESGGPAAGGQGQGQNNGQPGSEDGVPANVNQNAQNNANNNAKNNTPKGVFENSNQTSDNQ